MSTRSRNEAAAHEYLRRGTLTSSQPPEARLDVAAQDAAKGPGHGESDRATIAEIQRARIIAAMGELVRECGSGGVTVAHVVARSGVSRRTFYELFEDREDCFLATFDAAVARAGELVLPAYRGGGEWRERIAAGLEAALRFLDSERDMGYLCAVGVLGAGPRALERRARVAEALVSAVHEGRGETRATRRPDRLVAEGVVGAVLAIVHTRLREQSPKPLLGLASRLMALIVLPYLGASAAERELRRAAPRTRKVSPPRGDPLRELDMRLTYRTVRVLEAIASSPSSNNRQVGSAAGIADQGQISKLLSRLQALGLIANTGGDHNKGEPNAWSLTATGEAVQRTLKIQAA
jgi:AcrR family transcriptional regulator